MRQYRNPTTLTHAPNLLGQLCRRAISTERDDSYSEANPVLTEIVAPRRDASGFARAMT
jgi:hypothetical protein